MTQYPEHTQYQLPPKSPLSDGRWWEAVNPTKERCPECGRRTADIAAVRFYPLMGWRVWRECSACEWFNRSTYAGDEEVRRWGLWQEEELMDLVLNTPPERGGT